MTAQMPENFINEHPRIDVSHLKLYFVSAELPAKPNPPENYTLSTDLWRRYVATWRLNFDGTLELLQFEFPDFPDDDTVVQKLEPQTVAGDFTLTFRPFFHGPNTEIPFVDGRVIEDRSKWEMDDQTIDVEVSKALDGSGLVVRTLWGWAIGFLPKSLLLDPSTKLTELVGQELKCEVFRQDEDRGTFIVKQVQES